jgi:acetyl/propionyl-CoA carboxylase alpha subunit/acetyl-CoA carboxylase carboxyltransferase component
MIAREPAIAGERGRMHRQLERIAIVNRGEAAMRLINAVRELRIETGADLRTIALHTDAERTAMFVRESDEAVCIDRDRAPDAGSPYLDLEVLAAALHEARADAAWVGWGFVAERPEFAELCQRLGVVFIGPGPDVMRRLGDKIGAKLLAEKADVPVAPWSGGPVATVADAERHAVVIGYPLMIKATAGGGGRGIRRVDDPARLAEAFESARAESEKAFGDPTVFIERVVTGARHVEVQIVGDTHGTMWAVGVRDCSLQRRNQKVIEESHCTALTGEQDRDLRAAAVRLAAAAGYTNAGTVEFLYQPDEQSFAFLEVNTRLQVEHPVTEETTGLDLVKLQLHVANGGRLDGDPPAASGYAIEARLNAEDPQRAFAPAPGVVETLAFPVGPGIRVDTGIAEGDVIPPQFDSMIAKVIAAGRTRDEARARLVRALAQTTVIVRGGTTNKAFLLDLLDRPEVRTGEVDTAWLDRLTAAGEHLPTRHGSVGLLAAALDAYALHQQRQREHFLGWASRGRPHADLDVGQVVELRHGGHTYRVDVRRIGPTRYALKVDGRTVAVVAEPHGAARSKLAIEGGPAFSVVSSIQEADHLVEVEGVAHRFSRDDAGVVRAPAAALVVAVGVDPGDEVEAGDRLAVVEAMKMEIPITSPVAGRVRDVFVARNVQVDAGAPLVRIEAAEAAGDAQQAAPRIDITEVTTRGADDDRCTRGVATLSAFFLGYDVDARSARAALDGLPPDCSQAAEPLGVFADLCAVAPDRRDPEGADDAARGPREYFNSFLRSLDPEREGLPEWFTERLTRAVGHYGVVGLEPGPRLVDALRCIYIAERRRDEQVPLVAGLLERVGTTAIEQDAALRDSLDHLIEATHRRYSPLASLARTVRHRCFDRPYIEAARGEVSASMKAIAARLVDDPQTFDPERLEPLVSCPLPLLPILAEHDALGAPPTRAPLLDVLTRRYYTIRDLGPSRIVDVDGHEVLLAEYTRSSRVVHVAAVACERTDLTPALAAVAATTGSVGPPDTIVVDVYLAQPIDHAHDVDTLSAEVHDLLASAALPGPVRRVAIVAYTTGPEVVRQHLTFRRGGVDGVRPFWMSDEGDDTDARDDPTVFEEDIKFRGIHPMIARRLQMWRLANFEITRLDRADDIHLFDCVARDNASDERLVVVAEVRDVTPLRDADGRVTALPEIEHVLVGCLDTLRDELARRADPRRLEWNRVLLYVWPVVDLPIGEMTAVARRLTPLTEGLGIEQVVVSGRLAAPRGGEPIEAVVRLGYEAGHGLTVRVTEPPKSPMQPLGDYDRRRLQTRRRGLVYPYELVPLLRGDDGTFVEYDLDEDGRLSPVDRKPGENSAGIVVGLVSTPTARYPEGMLRVALMGDPTKAMGSITEAECRRLLAAVDLAAELGVPIEWFALSAGAKIAMDSGSENLDWVARVLRRLVEHTQRGGEVNVVVAGINVGAQPYWNAEATMLMHTRGILVMTPDSAMVLTGKQAIDYSGGVSAEDNLGIGGYGRVMGPNGESQYWAPSLAAACELLFDHYELTYRAPGERWPRPSPTTDPGDRDVQRSEHRVEGSEFISIGDIFSPTANPDRKKPFDIRTLMNATIDVDHPPLERWPAMAEAETAVVYEARLGGLAVTMIGIESRPLPRHGSTPADGPAQWSAGTLFPLSSKKVARAVNAASGCRPVVVLANLSGFDGSPESLRRLQLEYGAEIGRAIVNFDGPFVLCVVSRYHGGAFVVFSATLNDDMEVLAVEGSFASVIGGAPAAAVVFTREVDERTRADERIQHAEASTADVADDEQVRRRAALAELWDTVRTEKLGEVAAAFDSVHSVERAQQVGSVHRIIAAADLRPELIAAVERGMQRVAARATQE